MTAQIKALVQNNPSNQNNQYYPSKMIEGWKDSALYTPGPLTTSRTVKQAMLRDLGSRDSEFIALTQSIRSKLLEIAALDPQQFTAVIMQGSGTFGVESVLTSTVPKTGHVLVLSNGAYGSRMAQMVKTAGVSHQVLEYLENQKPDLAEIERTLQSCPHITHVALVHCETTSGIFNPIQEVGQLCHKWDKTYIVDAMSSFGAVPIDIPSYGIDYLISSSNKCIEGVPGFSFVIARRSKLLQTEGWARSLSLDLYSQWKALETAGEFRFTPPIQVILAFAQALEELEKEGGITARSLRYQRNHSLLVKGMTDLGFKTYLRAEDLGYIITSFCELEHPSFNYRQFYEKLQQRGYVIYSGKVTNATCFRIGNIGRIFESDIRNLLSGIRETLQEMQIIA